MLFPCPSINSKSAREGANLVVSANEDLVHGVAEKIRADGGKAISFIGDVTDKESVTALYDDAEKEFGSVDVSIQNAGVI
ncbi:SDR family NAD(P)-dependent oxidoreductase, partial [Rhizobium ruizarguesonis]